MVTADNISLVRISRSDAACILSLAAAVGLGDIDHVSEPQEALPGGDDYCSVWERVQMIDPTVTRQRMTTIVREANEHYDGYEPTTWISRCGWKASPAMISTWDVHRIPVGDRAIEMQLIGADPVDQDEATRIAAAVEAELQSKAPVEPSLLSGCTLEQITGIERPVNLAREVFPQLVPHDLPGHRLAAVHFSRDALSGYELVVCVEGERLLMVTGATWRSTPSTHRCDR